MAQGYAFDNAASKNITLLTTIETTLDQMLDEQEVQNSLLVAIYSLLSEIKGGDYIPPQQRASELSLLGVR